MDDETNDAASNPNADEHLPVAGEILEEDEHISQDVLEDLNEG